MNEILNDEKSFAALARRIGIIPVVTIEHVSDAVALARALVQGGLPIVEVTLRTEAAFDAIRAIASEVPEAHVGAGTVREPEQGRSAISAGARFIVSPGVTDRLLDAASDWSVPYLPGAATPSEIMRLAERGIAFMKLFPAESVGGVRLLKSLAAPLQGIQFCPTGGIDQENAEKYLALPNVNCVGGSWMIPRAALAARDWRSVEQFASKASEMASRESR